MGPYYPGMQKEAAKSVGLTDCSLQVGGYVLCSPVHPISIGTKRPLPFQRLEFNAKTGTLQRIRIEGFVPYEDRHTFIFEVESKFANDSVKSRIQRSASGCIFDRSRFERGGDSAVEVCYEGKKASLIVVSFLDLGAGERLKRRLAKEKAEHQQAETVRRSAKALAESYNSSTTSK